jgi:hypothetical protein
MERNTILIREIGELREKITQLQEDFNKQGGIRKLTEIMKGREERDLLLEQLEV